MNTCPACGSNRVFRSKTRTAFERLRRQFTMKRPYRCHACNWRGWATDGPQAAPPTDVPESAVAPPDLSAIDAALEDAERTAAKARPRGDQIPDARSSAPGDSR